MQSLTSKETRVMKCLWDSEEKITSSEITRRANERYGSDWKLTTVSTFLTHLVNKGFLKLERNGKVYTYEILISEEEYLQYEMGRMADFWAGGTSGKLIAALKRGKKVSSEDLKGLREMIDELDGENYNNRSV
ncbi:MAG: BlaI/MecI/CopY family transcriptional regulator [Lachnospiraceae bacterium]|nr:BlaI/MecI/CopY family transcriptional regulator [Lachnospiraceae bacterium]